MTKVDIISGFLGAGKTTFIKKLIDQVFTGEKLVLIENEFGEIGIDGGFLKDAGIEITEMNSGCICCTLVGDFSEALKKVIAEYHPDRVIIEPSGVGKLSDVAKAVEDVKADADIEITGRITVVDGKKAKMYMKNFGEFFKDQVEHASTIVISRTQMMSDAKVEECVHMLREENEKAAIISTPWDNLGKAAIMRALEQGAELEDLLETVRHHDHESYCAHAHDHDCAHAHAHDHHHDHARHLHEDGNAHEVAHHHHDRQDNKVDHENSCDHAHHAHDCHDHADDHHAHDHDHAHAHHAHDCHDHAHAHHTHAHHHHADEVFTSWGKETPHKYTDKELDYLVKALSQTEAYGTILRSKGIVPMTDGSWKQFDLVPEEYEVREGQADYAGRVCVIGTDLKEDELLKLFHI